MAVSLSCDKRVTLMCMRLLREAGFSIIALLFTYLDHLTFSDRDTELQTQGGIQT